MIALFILGLLAQAPVTASAPALGVNLHVIIPPLRTEEQKVAQDLVKRWQKRRDIQLNTENSPVAEYTVEIIFVGKRPVGSSNTIVPGQRVIDGATVAVAKLCMPAKDFCAMIEGESNTVLPNVGSAVNDLERKIRRAVQPEQTKSK